VCRVGGTHLAGCSTIRLYRYIPRTYLHAHTPQVCVWMYICARSGGRRTCLLLSAVPSIHPLLPPCPSANARWIWEPPALVRPADKATPHPHPPPDGRDIRIAGVSTLAVVLSPRLHVEAGTGVRGGLDGRPRKWWDGRSAAASSLPALALPAPRAVEQRRKEGSLG